ncbi:MAG: EVE domain-containing protein [Alphaproteobacteria bacterium]|nr:EVE domain-containing protein [Alphaproteobacteria bacterium]
MSYWLIKTEPSSWSWNDQIKHKVTSWDGVRNYQAANNMKAMNKGDLAFFYHSVHEKSIVGIVEVIRTYHPDPTDLQGRFGMVEVKFMKTVPHPVTLEMIKADSRLSPLALVKQSRLSVMPIDDESWKILCKMGGIVD